MLRRVGFAGIILWLFVMPVLAQEAAPGATPSREDVLKLLEVTQSRQQLDYIEKNFVTQVKETARGNLESKNAKVSQEKLGELDAFVDKLFKGVFGDDMLEDMVPIYQRHFTKPDIQSIIAFYSSPAGVKFVESAPAIMDETMQVSSARMQKKMELLMSQVKQKVEQMAQTPPKQSTGKVAPKKPPVEKSK